MLAKDAKARGMNPIVYHSRFRYGDRVQKHRSAIDAFKEKGAALVLTTQVCEVSLDISSQLLVTDLAPPGSLIQRLGRLNRRVQDSASCVDMPAFFLQPDGSKPYTEREMELARKWIDLLGESAVSQADLDDALIRISEEE
jgi:CRISPR-associated endonuclease/helicase Cas3